MDVVTVILVIFILLFLLGGVSAPRPVEGPAVLNLVLYVLAVVVIIVVVVRLLRLI
jgi:hypothetical protein